MDQAHYFKGVRHFLAALTLLPDHIRGVIVGEGNLRAVYISLAEQLGLEKLERRNMGMAGRQKVQDQYAWDKIEDRLEGIYQDVLKSAYHIKSHYGIKKSD